MILKKITKENFDLFYNLLEQDFCFEERRSRQDEFKALKNKKFNPLLIYDNETLIGYIAYWEFDNFVFGEHFAILKEFRSRGYGGKFLLDFAQSLKKPFVFEIELPIESNQIRRKNLYERLEFKFNDYKYFQPSYHKNTKPIEMIFVSYPEKLSQSKYFEFVDIIKKEVYNLE